MSDSVMASASPDPPHPPSGDSSLWKEYKNAEGRPYWFHTIEKRSVWERPDELKSPRERAIAKTKWKEYTSGERKYYVHSETKETTWNLPQELKDLFDALPSSSTSAASPANAPQKPSPAPAIPAAAQDGQSAGSESPAAAVAPGPAPGPPPSLPPSLNGPPRPVYAGPPPGFGGNNSPANGPPPPAGPAAMMGRPPPTGPAASTMPNPNFASPQDAFRFLLQSKGVTASSTWEQTMRDIVTDPLYKSLRSLAERKGVFTQYQADLRVKEQEEKQLKKQQVRPAVLDLLRKGAEAGKIKEYSSWRTVLKHFGQTDELKSATEAIGEADAMSLWDEVKKELVAAADLTVRELRHRNMDLLMSLLRTFEADATTRWRDADRTVRESSEWKQDAHLSSMDVSDMIIVFEEYIRSIEREESDRRKEVEKMRVRNERKRREVFRKWMEEGRVEGWIHSKTTWEDVYKRIQNDERFTSMLGQRGSSPLDLFLDVLDTCHKSIESRTAAVEQLLKLGGGAESQSSSRSSSTTALLVQEGTTWEEFTSKVQAGLERARHNGEADKWTAVAQEDQELKLVFEELLSVAQRANREARKRHERHLRHLIDDARYGLKKSADDTLLRQAEEGIPYDEVASILDGLGSREWRKLDEDLQDETERLDAKKTTWEKFCRRQKEKAEERKAAAASAPPPIDDSRDRGDRARRREDRGDRRRGEAMDYTNGSTSDARGSDRRLRRGADDHEVEEGEEFNSSSSRKRSRRDVDGGGGETSKSSIPPGTSYATAASTGRPVVSGGGAGEEDDDKEEGEV